MRIVVSATSTFGIFVWSRKLASGTACTLGLGNLLLTTRVGRHELPKLSFKARVGFGLRAGLPQCCQCFIIALAMLQRMLEPSPLKTRAHRLLCVVAMLSQPHLIEKLLHCCKGWVASESDVTPALRLTSGHKPFVKGPGARVLSNLK